MRAWISSSASAVVSSSSVLASRSWFSRAVRAACSPVTWDSLSCRVSCSSVSCLLSSSFCSSCSRLTWRQSSIQMWVTDKDVAGNVVSFQMPLPWLFPKSHPDRLLKALRNQGHSFVYSPKSTGFLRNSSLSFWNKGTTIVAAVTQTYQTLVENVEVVCDELSSPKLRVSKDLYWGISGHTLHAFCNQLPHFILPSNSF